MKIIKISSRKDWQKYIEEFKQELKEKDIDKKEKKIRIKFFNYIKTKNIKTTFFHGTSKSLYEKMKENEYMMSPIYLKSNQYEKRDEALDKIFFTKNINVANYYKQRAEEQTNSEGTLLVLNIPIYRISEIQSAIFDSYTYNEGNSFISIKNIINKYMPDLINNFDQYKDELINEILTIVNNYNHPEFTVYGMIPTNQTKSGFQYIKKADEIEDEQWFKWIENEQINPTNTPENIQQQITDEQWFQWIKKNKVDLLKTPTNFKQKIPKEKWIQWVENNEIDPIDLPNEIKKQITDVNKWIQWVENDKIDLMNLPNEIKEQIELEQWIQWVDDDDIEFITIHSVPNEIQKQFSIEQWIQWVEKNKVSPIYLPVKIKKQIELNQWIEWIDNNKILSLSIPKEIQEQIPIKKWIEWVENNKVKPLSIPKEIQQQITDENQWIKWIKNYKIDIKDVPDHIKEKINQQKQSMNCFKFIKRNIK